MEIRIEKFLKISAQAHSHQTRLSKKRGRYSFPTGLFKKNNSIHMKYDLISRPHLRALAVGLATAASSYFLMEVWRHFRQRSRRALFGQPSTSRVNLKLRVTDLYVYPVKSCKGIRVDSWNVGEFGFDFDRRSDGREEKEEGGGEEKKKSKSEKLKLNCIKLN